MAQTNKKIRNKKNRRTKKIKKKKKRKRNEIKKKIKANPPAWPEETTKNGSRRGTRRRRPLGDDCLVSSALGVGLVGKVMCQIAMTTAVVCPSVLAAAAVAESWLTNRSNSTEAVLNFPINSFLLSLLSKGPEGNRKKPKETEGRGTL